MEEYIVFTQIKITDWIKAVGVILGIPVTFIAFVKLFRKDKKHEEAILKLTNLTDSQYQINDSLKSQIEELSKQTEKLNQRNLFLIDANRLNLQMLELEKKKYDDLTRIKYENLKGYLLETLKGLLDPISNQIKYLEEEILKLSKRKNDQYEFKFSIPLQSQSISKINNQDLFKILVTDSDLESKDKIKLFLGLESAISFISNVVLELKKEYQKFMDQYSIHEANWQLNIQKLHSIIEDMVGDSLREGMDIKENQLLIALNENFKNWIQADEDINIVREIYFMRDNYLLEVRKICRKYVLDARIKLIVPLIVECETAFENIDYLRNVIKETFSNYKNELNRSKKQILNVIDKL